MELMTNNPALAGTVNNVEANSSVGMSQRAKGLPVQQETLDMPPRSLELHLAAARIRLELADTAEERRHAIAAAVDLGMPLWEIEQYLDWLDARQAYRAITSDVPSWMNRFFHGINPVRTGIDALRRVGRRLFDSANPT